MATQLGLIVQRRRQDMALTLSRFSSVMGGSPGESFLSKVESGHFTPTPTLAKKLAEGLQLPPDTMLNAAGHATDSQQEVAQERLRQLLLDVPPSSAMLPVVSAENAGRLLGKRAVMLRQKEDAFIVDMHGAENEPYIGELVVSKSRTPADGQGVVVVMGNSLSAWTYHILPREAAYIENARGEKMTRGFELMGVILRVTTTRDLLA